ncbi:hypothetical protein HDU67_002224 [Dinochytrium kinnereticum]|nr:hypothetical protein HDU67_002224 [Dinochytrium kinnereticum]
MGRPKGNGVILNAEESLYLVDRGNLAIRSQDVEGMVAAHEETLMTGVMSVQETWGVVMDNWEGGFEVYQRLGFMVFRSDELDIGKSERRPRSVGTSFLGFPRLPITVTSFLTKVVEWIKGWALQSLSCAFSMIGFGGYWSVKTRPMTVDHVRPFFDVYKPNPRFKKSAKGQPEFKVVVVSARSPIPNLSSLISLRRSLAPGTLLKIAVVDGVQIKFLDVAHELIGLDEVPRRHHKSTKKKKKKKAKKRGGGWVTVGGAVI